MQWNGEMIQSGLQERAPFPLLLLTFIALPLVKVALLFCFPEYFALALMGLTLVTSFSGESMIKGIISGLFGLFIS